MDERERKGLSPEHHGEMNHPLSTGFWKEKGITLEDRVKELREEYAGDDVARQQLDVYEGGNNEYHTQLKKYVEAFKSGNLEQQNKLEQWFKTNYPDI